MRSSPRSASWTGAGSSSSAPASSLPARGLAASVATPRRSRPRRSAFPPSSTAAEAEVDLLSPERATETFEKYRQHFGDYPSEE
eukprot:12879035-Alexandrium_andersonii.AAC.1